MIGCCPYCGGPPVDPTPEHGIPRSLGADHFVVPTCGSCNATANETIDQPMMRCAVVRHWRADANVVRVDGQPYRVQMDGDVIAAVRAPSHRVDANDADALVAAFTAGERYEMPGARVLVGLRDADMLVRFAGSSGSMRVDGHRVVYGSDPHLVRSDGPPPDRECDGDGDGMLLIAKVRAEGCAHDVDLWPRFAAKVGLGAIALVGRPRGHGPDHPAVDLTSPCWGTVVEGLRSIAFDRGRGAEGCDPYGVVGVRPKPEHVVNVVNHQDGVSVQVLLFGSLDLRANVPGVAVDQGFTITVGARTDVRRSSVPETRDRRQSLV